MDKELLNRMADLMTVEARMINMTGGLGENSLYTGRLGGMMLIARLMGVTVEYLHDADGNLKKLILNTVNEYDI